jgi:hypothetical protein
MREFSGIIYHGIPAVKSYSGRDWQTDEEKYELDRREVEAMKDLLRGRPIKSEHGKDHNPVGTVLRSYVETAVSAGGGSQPVDTWRVDFQIDDSTYEGACTCAWIDTKHQYHLSLTHLPRFLQPMEVSVVQVPARDRCVVDRGIIPFEDAIKASRYKELYRNSSVPVTPANCSVVLASAVASFLSGGSSADTSVEIIMAARSAPPAMETLESPPAPVAAGRLYPSAAEQRAMSLASQGVHPGGDAGRRADSMRQATEKKAATGDQSDSGSDVDEAEVRRALQQKKKEKRKQLKKQLQKEAAGEEEGAEDEQVLDKEHVRAGAAAAPPSGSRDEHGRFVPESARRTGEPVAEKKKKKASPQKGKTVKRQAMRESSDEEEEAEEEDVSAREKKMRAERRKEKERAMEADIDMRAKARAFELLEKKSLLPSPKAAEESVTASHLADSLAAWRANEESGYTPRGKADAMLAKMAQGLVPRAKAHADAQIAAGAESLLAAAESSGPKPVKMRGSETRPAKGEGKQPLSEKQQKKLKKEEKKKQTSKPKKSLSERITAASDDDDDEEEDSEEERAVAEAAERRARSNARLAGIKAGKQPKSNSKGEEKEEEKPVSASAPAAAIVRRSDWGHVLGLSSMFGGHESRAYEGASRDVIEASAPRKVVQTYGMGGHFHDIPVEARRRTAIIPGGLPSSKENDSKSPSDLEPLPISAFERMRIGAAAHEAISGGASAGAAGSASSSSSSAPMWSIASGPDGTTILNASKVSTQCAHIATRCPPRHKFPPWIRDDTYAMLRKMSGRKADPVPFTQEMRDRERMYAESQAGTSSRKRGL